MPQLAMNSGDTKGEYGSPGNAALGPKGKGKPAKRRASMENRDRRRSQRDSVGSSAPFISRRDSIGMGQAPGRRHSVDLTEVNFHAWLQDEDEGAEVKEMRAAKDPASAVAEGGMKPPGVHAWTTGCMDVNLPPIILGDLDLEAFEDKLITAVVGPPEKGNRVLMPPGDNATIYRWRLRENYPDTAVGEVWTYDGVGLRVWWLPPDCGCPFWAEPEPGVKLSSDDKRWIEEFKSRLNPQLFLDPVKTPLDPLRDRILWDELTADRPWGQRHRRVKAQRFLSQKLGEGAPAHIEIEGLRGLWELATSKEHRLDFEPEAFQAVSRVLCESSDHYNLSIAAIIIWTMAVQASTRLKSVESGCMKGLLRCINMGLALAKPPNPKKKEHPGVAKLDAVGRQELRDRMIVSGLGAMAILAVDKKARHDLLREEHQLSTLVAVMGLKVNDMKRVSASMNNDEDTKAAAAAAAAAARAVIDLEDKAEEAAAGAGAGQEAAGKEAEEGAEAAPDGGGEEEALAALAEGAGVEAEADGESVNLPPLNTQTAPPAELGIPMTPMAASTPESDAALIALMENLPPYAKPILEVKGRRRRWATDTLYSVLLRDREARAMFALTGGIQTIVPFLNSPSPHVRYVCALIMASYAKDVSEGEDFLSKSGAVRAMFDGLMQSAQWGIRLLQQGMKKADDGSGPVAIVPIVEAATLAAWSVSGSLVQIGCVTREDAAITASTTVRTKETAGVSTATAYLAGIIATFAQDVRSAASTLLAVGAPGINPPVGPRAALRAVLKPPTFQKDAKNRGSGMIRATAAGAVAALARHSYAHPTRAHWSSESHLVGPFIYLVQDGNLHHAVIEANSAPCGNPTMSLQLEMACAETTMQVSLASYIDLDDMDAESLLTLMAEEHKCGAKTAALLAAGAWGMARGSDGFTTGRALLLKAGGVRGVTDLLLRYLPMCHNPQDEGEAPMKAVTFAIGAVWALLVPPLNTDEGGPHDNSDRGIYSASEDMILGVRLKRGPRPVTADEDVLNACRALITVARLPPHPVREGLRALAVQAIWAICYRDEDLRAAFVHLRVWKHLAEDVLAKEPRELVLIPGGELVAPPSGETIFPPEAIRAMEAPLSIEQELEDSVWDRPVKFTPQPPPEQYIAKWRTPALQLMMFLASDPERFEEEGPTWRDDLARVLTRELARVLLGDPHPVPEHAHLAQAYLPECRDALLLAPSCAEHSMAVLLGVDMMTSSVMGRRAVEPIPAFSKNLCKLFAALRPWELPDDDGEVAVENIPRRRDSTALGGPERIGLALMCHAAMEAAGPVEAITPRRRAVALEGLPGFRKRFEGKIFESADVLGKYDAYMSQVERQNAMIAAQTKKTAPPPPIRMPVDKRAVVKARWVAAVAIIVSDLDTFSCDMWHAKLDELCAEVRGAPDAMATAAAAEARGENDYRVAMARRMWYKAKGVPDPVLLTLKAIGALSSREPLQVLIGKAAGRHLLDLTLDWAGDSRHTMHLLAARHALDSLKKHPANVTLLYKLELESKIEAPSLVAGGHELRAPGADAPLRLKKQILPVRPASREGKGEGFGAEPLESPEGTLAEVKAQFKERQKAAGLFGSNRMPETPEEYHARAVEEDAKRENAVATRRAGLKKMMQPRRMLWRAEDGPAPREPPKPRPGRAGAKDTFHLPNINKRASSPARPKSAGRSRPPKSTDGRPKSPGRRPGTSADPGGTEKLWSPNIREFQVAKSKNKIPQQMGVVDSHTQLARRLLAVPTNDLAEDLKSATRGRLPTPASPTPPAGASSSSPRIRMHTPGSDGRGKTKSRMGAGDMASPRDLMSPRYGSPSRRAKSAHPAKEHVVALAEKVEAQHVIGKGALRRPRHSADDLLDASPQNSNPVVILPSVPKSRVKLHGEVPKLSQLPAPAVDAAAEALAAMQLDDGAECEDLLSGDAGASSSSSAAAAAAASPGAAAEGEGAGAPAGGEGAPAEDDAAAAAAAAAKAAAAAAPTLQRRRSSVTGEPLDLSWDEQTPAKLVLEETPGMVYEFDSVGYGSMGNSVFLFEHTDGCVFCQGLYGHYRLPNGRLAHVYQPERGPGFSIPVLTPPEPWLMHPSRLLFLGPLPDGTGAELAKPHADPGAQSKRYVPIPVLAPDPDMITLRVVDTDVYAHLAEDPIEIYVEQANVFVSGEDLKIVGATRDAYKAKAPEKPFDLNNSVFAPRKNVEADCKSFYETPNTDMAMFERIWKDMLSKQQCSKFMYRELGAKTEDQFAEYGGFLKDALEEMWPTIRKVYEWFCLGGGTGDAFTLSFNGWTLMHQDLGVVDEGSKLVQSGHVDNVFYSSNFMDKKDERANQNSELSLNRHEFMESLLRLAHAKFVADPKTRGIPGVAPGHDALEHAMSKLLEEHLEPCLPPSLTADRNSFLRDRLYCREVNNLYKGTDAFPTLELLKELYAIFSFTRKPHKLDTKGCTGISLYQWCEFLDQYGFIGGIEETMLSLDEARLIFKCSQMNVVDEYKAQIRLQTLRWVDFLEALGRVAEVIELPTLKTLQASGFTSHIQWGDIMMVDANNNRVEAEEDEDEGLLTMRTQDDVDLNRPLASKIECLLDMLFARVAEKENPTVSEIKAAFKRLKIKRKNCEYNTIMKLGNSPAHFIRKEYDK